MAYNQIYTIYKCTCINTGMSYIGFTGNMSNRIASHKRESVVSERKLYKSIREHGWDNFEWMAIYQSHDKSHCLDVMEPHFISEYNSMQCGYNMTLGGGRPIGSCGKSKTSSHREKLSKALRGRKQSAATRLKKSLAFRGRKQTTEWAAKRAATCKGRVTVVDKHGCTNIMLVNDYYKQLHGKDSEWCMSRSTEGKRRLQEMRIGIQRKS